MFFGNEPPMAAFKHEQNEVTVTRIDENRNIINAQQQQELFKTQNNLFLPVADLEQPLFDIKPMGQFLHDPEEHFYQNINDGLSTKPHEYDLGQFAFNQNYSFSFSNFDYSAECKDLEQELLEECDIVIDDIQKEQNKFGLY
mmetsp:Transcript_16462/g.18307  ORF Transcript_16462/g.18307 Transcript_16462/m.18307 type:complete len:142 (+) Transcript_16462:214-639(+)